MHLAMRHEVDEQHLKGTYVSNVIKNYGTFTVPYTCPHH
jgi:hypothetical protein